LIADRASSPLSDSRSFKQHYRLPIFPTDAGSVIFVVSSVSAQQSFSHQIFRYSWRMGASVKILIGCIFHLDGSMHQKNKFLCRGTIPNKNYINTLICASAEESYTEGLASSLDCH
jgi:hypothetical protein